MLLIGQLFIGGLLVSEEVLIKQIEVAPLEVVGIEGFAGMCYFVVFLPIINLIPCNNDTLCSSGYVENTLEAFAQIEDEPMILALIILCMLSISFFNWTGISTTKNTSALARSIVDTSRTAFIWIISMFYGWEEFLWLEMIGFVILILGSLIYNEIFVLNIFGLKESVETINN